MVHFQTAMDHSIHQVQYKRLEQFPNYPSMQIIAGHYLPTSETPFKLRFCWRANNDPRLHADWDYLFHVKTVDLVLIESVKVPMNTTCFHVEIK